MKKWTDNLYYTNHGISFVFHTPLTYRYGLGLQNQWSAGSKLVVRGSTPRRGASIFSVWKGSHMSRFSKGNFIAVIREIEAMERNGENIWVPIGILEVMYDDDCGWFDEYFSTPPESRYSIDTLWYKIQMHILER